MASDDKAQKIEEVFASTQDEAQQIDEIARIRGWFSPDRDGEQYAAAIQDYLQDNISLEEIVKVYADVYIGSTDQVAKVDEDNGVFLKDSWTVVIHSAKRIPFRNTGEHAKLITFMKAFKEFKKPLSTGLPQFGMDAREAYNDCPGGGAGFTTPEINAWTNMNYFFARLTAEGIQNMYIYAIWAMRGALEQNFMDDEPSEYRHATAQQKYDAWVPAAAVWIFALGRKLYDKEEDLTPVERNRGNPARGGELWKGGSEFSKSRWSFWKKRFRAVATHDRLQESTKSIASEAADAMDKAEQG